MPLKKAALPEARAGTIGYKDGFNRYIRELKAGQHPGRHADCASKPYLAEISEDDMYRRYFRLALLASSSVFAGGIAQAQPPLPGVANRAPKSLTRTQLARIDRSQFPNCPSAATCTPSGRTVLLMAPPSSSSIRIFPGRAPSACI
jgi:hypothetical protein